MTTASAFGRLRSANPFLETPAPGDDALFDRITALPPDERLAARRPRRPRRLVVVLAVAAVAVLATTAFTFAHWVFPSFVEPSVTKKEYQRAQHELVLPPGYSWPKLHIPPDTVTSPGAGGGHAVLAAENAWQCYWVRAIRTDDVTAQTRARAELTRLLEVNTIEIGRAHV